MTLGYSSETASLALQKPKFCQQQKKGQVSRANNTMQRCVYIPFPSQLEGKYRVNFYCSRYSIPYTLKYSFSLSSIPIVFPHFIILLLSFVQGLGLRTALHFFKITEDLKELKSMWVTMYQQLIIKIKIENFFKNTSMYKHILYQPTEQ